RTAKGQGEQTIFVCKRSLTVYCLRDQFKRRYNQTLRSMGAYMTTLQIDPSKIPSLAKAAWALAVALVALASAIFYAGVHWADFTSRLDKIEAAAKRLETYQTLEGTRKVPARTTFPANCPPGHVVTGATLFSEAIEVTCGKL